MNEYDKQQHWNQFLVVYLANFWAFAHLCWHKNLELRARAKLLEILLQRNSSINFVAQLMLSI